MHNAPIVLTQKNKLNDGILYAAKTNKIKDVYIIGGKNSVSESVESEIKKHGFNVKRISGADRFETALAIDDEIYNTENRLSHSARKVGFSNGNIFADALSAAPYVYYRQMHDHYTFLPYKKGYSFDIDNVFGGESAINPNTRLNDDFIRISGNDRYETAVKIANECKKMFPNGVKYVTIVSGDNFADAISAAPLATSKSDGVILLTNKDKLNENVKKFLLENNSTIIKTYIVGGEGSISKDVENEINIALNEDSYSLNQK